METYGTKSTLYVYFISFQNKCKIFNTDSFERLIGSRGGVHGSGGQFFLCWIQPREWWANTLLSTSKLQLPCVNSLILICLSFAMVVLLKGVPFPPPTPNLHLPTLVFLNDYSSRAPSVSFCPQNSHVQFQPILQTGCWTTSRKCEWFYKCASSYIQIWRFNYTKSYMWHRHLMQQLHRLGYLHPILKFKFSLINTCFGRHKHGSSDWIHETLVKAWHEGISSRLQHSSS